MDKFYLGDSGNRLPECNVEVYRTWICRIFGSSQAQLGCPAGDLCLAALGCEWSIFPGTAVVFHSPWPLPWQQTFTENLWVCQFFSTLFFLLPAVKSVASLKSHTPCFPLRLQSRKAGRSRAVVFSRAWWQWWIEDFISSLWPHWIKLQVPGTPLHP